MCCTVDEKGVMVAHHGDCKQDNCPANWRKAVKEKQNDN